MTVDFTTGGHFEFNNGDTGTVSFDTGYTIEFRARVVSSPSTWNFSVIALPGAEHNDQIRFCTLAARRPIGVMGFPRCARFEANDGSCVPYRAGTRSGKFSVWRDGVLSVRP
jgi:hypothetical protein